MQNRRSALAALGVFALAAPALTAANLPRQAPDFAVNLNNGKQATLKQYQGKVVALIFILTACPHCQKTVRCLIREQDEFGARGFQALGSAIEPMAQINLPEFIRQFKPTFPVGYNPQRPVLDFMQHVPMVGPLMPLLAFIDRQGKIRAQYEGNDPFLAEDQMEKNIREKIAALLEEGGPAPPGKRPTKKTGAPGKKQTISQPPAVSSQP
ncbi:MAG: TlpA family protein disulfide reductase [Acidobacteriia bacterium]|nr:TlpA family protein disulfide reductase [Terriglobia bacterium]